MEEKLHPLPSKLRYNYVNFYVSLDFDFFIKYVAHDSFTYILTYL